MLNRETNKKIPSVRKILLLIILGLGWLILGVYFNGSVGLFSEGFHFSNPMFNKLEELFGLLILTGPYFGLTLFIFGIIKYFERRKALK